MPATLVHSVTLGLQTVTSGFTLRISAGLWACSGSWKVRNSRSFLRRSGGGSNTPHRSSVAAGGALNTGHGGAGGSLGKGGWATELLKQTDRVQYLQNLQL